jgi:hypothetical protein
LRWLHALRCRLLATLPLRCACVACALAACRLCVADSLTHHVCACARVSLRRTQNLIFRFLQSKQRIQIWLYENTDTRIEGRIIVSAHNLLLLIKYKLLTALLLRLTRGSMST